MMMDCDRLTVISDALKRLSIVASVMLVTYSVSGAALTGLTEFKQTLKNKILVIIGDIPLK